MYKICFYAPKDHAEPIKNAMFKAGGGQIGNYACCAWQTLGEGQFAPLQGSNPFIGAENQLEKVPEYKIEMVCADHLIEKVVLALREHHPYEEPAYQVFKLEKF